MRQELLNLELFASALEAQIVIDDSRHEFDECRPDGSLNRVTPSEFAARWRAENATRIPWRMNQGAGLSQTHQLVYGQALNFEGLGSPRSEESPAIRRRLRLQEPGSIRCSFHRPRGRRSVSCSHHVGTLP